MKRSGEARKPLNTEKHLIVNKSFVVEPETSPNGGWHCVFSVMQVTI